MNSGYTGISFPFRIGVKGGVVMSSTSDRDVPHIVEGMQQLLSTFKFERPMEYQIFSDIDSSVFDPNDVSTQTLISYQVRNALLLEPRIEVIDVLIYSVDSTVFATVTFKVALYDSVYATDLKVGDLNVQSN